MTYLDLIRDADWKLDHNKITLGEFGEMIEPLRQEIKPHKRGKWRWELASNGWANHICSECGFKENTDIHVKLNWKFCPKCGVEMVGDTDETN